MSTEDNRTWNPVGWFEIYVTDMDRAKAFYGDVVQRDFTPAPMSGGDMESGSLRLNAGPKGPLAG